VPGLEGDRFIGNSAARPAPRIASATRWRSPPESFIRRAAPAPGIKRVERRRRWLPPHRGSAALARSVIVGLLRRRRAPPQRRLATTLPAPAGPAQYPRVAAPAASGARNGALAGRVAAITTPALAAAACR
jgi:hypothetical protein